MNRKINLILLALEELKNASYSVERREECEELIREIEMSDWKYTDNTKCPVAPNDYVRIEDDLGNQEEGFACEFDWLIQEPGCRIVKYEKL